MRRLGTIPSVEANDDQLISAEWVRQNAPARTMAQLTAFTAIQVAAIPYVNITDAGKEGAFIYDPDDTTTANNVGTVIVTASGARYKRRYSGDIYASWFIDTADTTGTSGNRERNAINRAYTYVAAQINPQAVILDNSRIWYVNNNAIYLNIATGKKITIRGEGNPVIDFLCTGATDASNNEAVFRTANSWTYPDNAGSQYTGSISGTTLTITAVATGTLKVGQLVYGTNIKRGTYIIGAGTGTGGTGTYIVNKTQTVSSATYYSRQAEIAWSNRTISYGSIEISGIIFDGNRNPPNAGSSTVFSRPLFFRHCKEVNVLGCTFQNIPGSALAIGVSDGGEISNNTFRSVFARNTPDNIGDAITIYAYCENLRITNNSATLTSGQSGRCGISVDDYCRNSIVSNNTIVGYERAIHVEASKSIVTSNNTVEKSPIGIISGANIGCHFSDNYIDGRNPVFGATLSAAAHLFVYEDIEGTYTNNTIIGNKLKGELDYLSKFWGERLIVSGNKFRWINDHTNQTLSTTSNTIANGGSKTFTYLTAPDLVWEVGDRIKVFKDDFNYMIGNITAVSSTSVTITSDTASGSGTHTSWTLRYALSGSVYGSGFNDDNKYNNNVFEYANLEVDDTARNIIKNNIFYSAYILAQNTNSVAIKENEFVPFAGETYGKGVSVYGATNAHIAGNTFTNPIEYVVNNGTTTGMVCEDNTYIRTNANAAGNGYWYVNSALADTNVNRVGKPNRIIDYVNTDVWYVWNTGTASRAYKFKTEGDVLTIGAYSITLNASATTNITLPTTGTLATVANTETLTNKRITARVQSTASTSTFTFDFNNDDIGIITAQAAALTVASPSGTPTQGQPFVIRIKDNGTARGITWNGVFRAVGVTLPTTTVINKTMYISGYYNTTDSKIDIVGVATES